ncbi:hypothetical protein BJV74DRAFT_954486 [Russula compacta]|nr:hypothetical protein BJV74DRAFT_954486 [Russula compacta]
MSSLIPPVIEGGTYRCEYLCHSMDFMSGHSAMATDSTFDAGSPLQQGPTPLDEGCIDSWSPAISTYTHNHQVNTEAYWTAPHRSGQSTLVLSFDKGTGPLPLEGLLTSIDDDECPVVHPSGSVGWPTFPCSIQVPYTPPNSIVQGPEGFGSGCVVCPTYVDTPNTRAFHTHALTRQLASQNYQLSPACQLLCKINKEYPLEDMELTKANIRAMFKVAIKYCGVFKWVRPYLVKKHIKKQHPGIDPDVALVEAKKTRRRATIVARRLAQQQVRLPPVNFRAAAPAIRAKPTHEDSGELKNPGTLATISFTEEYARPAGDLDIFGQSAQTWLVHSTVYATFRISESSVTL